MTATKNERTKEWHTTVDAGVAYLRVRTDGAIEYRHAETGEWIDLTKIESDLPAHTVRRIRDTAAKLLPELRDQCVRDDVRALEQAEYLVETNQGTYGAAEACRKVGCAEPQFADRNVYETVGGNRRETGPDEADAPGRMRQINRESLAADRRRLAEMRATARKH